MIASAAASADLTVGRVQPCERGFERGRGAVELDGDARHLFLEQPLPRAATGHCLLGEDDLFGLGEQVRPVAARGAQIVASDRQAIVGEQALDLLVGELGPLELEEQQLGVDDRRPLLDPLHPRAAGSVVSVAKSSPA